MAQLLFSQKKEVVEPVIDLFVVPAPKGNQNSWLSTMYLCTHCVA